MNADNSEFGDPRLAAVYDALDPDRSDLLPYLDLAERIEANRVLDIGCGTGTLALLLADRGVDVTGVDPAAASIDVARGKAGAEAVHWIVGTAPDVAGLFDLATMTANVVMAIHDLDPTMTALSTLLRPGGHLAMETRVPAAQAWTGWTKELTWHDAVLPDGARVSSWFETTAVRWPFIDMRGHFDVGEQVLSTMTLRYRELDELQRELVDHGFVVQAVDDAPDRPGREWIVHATRAG